jgi:hypothetical protein
MADVPKAKPLTIPPIEPRKLDRLQGFFTLDVIDKGKWIGRAESKEADIFTDQFGNWLAGMLQVPATGDHSISIKNNSGNALTLGTYYNSNNPFNYAYSTRNLGCYLSWGTGVTTPLRTDYEITTIVGTAVAATSVVYTSAAGTLVISGSATNTSGSSKTAAEAGSYGDWEAQTAGEKLFLLAHDLVSPTVVVPNNSSVSITWTVQM